MRTFRLLVVACGLLLLLTACNRDGSTDSDGDSSSSSRSATREGRSSSRAASVRSVAGGAASSRAAAPFFSLRSSSSVSSRAVTVPSSDGGTQEPAAAGNIKVHVEVDRGEARPGDQVTYLITVKNISSRAINSFQVVHSYSPAHLTVLEADGDSQPGYVQWSVTDLQPNQKRALRMKAVVAGTLPHGEVIRTNAIATLNGVVEPQTATTAVSIIDQLPTTGAGDNTRPVEDTSQYLTPYKGDRW